MSNYNVLPISEDELKTRIKLNYNRLAEGDYYSIEKVFARKDYDWYGDEEGRALLAFVCHYKISGNVIPCMELMLEQMELLIKDLNEGRGD